MRWNSTPSGGSPCCPGHWYASTQTAWRSASLAHNSRNCRRIPLSGGRGASEAHTRSRMAQLRHMRHRRRDTCRDARGPLRLQQFLSRPRWGTRTRELPAVNANSEILRCNMRLLHVTEASASGTLVVIRTLCERLANDGHAVAFAYGRRPETPPSLALAFPPAVDCIELPWAQRTPKAHLAAARALRALVRSWQPDVIHLHSAFAGVIGVLALGQSGVPLVYTPHGSPLGRSADGRFHLAAYTRMEAFVARRVALVGAVSQAEATLVARAAPGARIEVVPNGIEELEGALPPTPNRPRAQVVAMGRIVRQRRPSETAQILRAVSTQADVLLDRRWPAAETATVRAAGVPITGWLPRGEALDRLSAASVLVHWSASDGAPLVVLEAFARDVVVVGSDIPANRELLGAAQTCRRAEDAIALVRAVLADQSLHSELLTRQRTRRASSRSRRKWLRVGRLSMKVCWGRGPLAPEVIRRTPSTLLVRVRAHGSESAVVHSMEAAMGPAHRDRLRRRRQHRVCALAPEAVRVNRRAGPHP